MCHEFRQVGLLAQVLSERNCWSGVRKILFTPRAGILALEMKACVCVLLISISLLGCYGHPSGAPKSACSSLTPVHSGIKPQRESPPYSVSVTKNGNKVRVRIFSSVGEEIEGFALQARYSKDRQRIVDGRFTTKDGISKTIDCSNGKENTLTHVNPTPKREIVTEWTPSTSLDDDIVFRATVAKTFAIFWTEIDSAPVKIKIDAPTNSRSERKESRSDMYDACFVSKGCFGIPAGCINSQDCEVLLSYAKSSDGNLAFKLSGFLEDNSYMAFGLSYDPVMGDDSVTECVKTRDNLIARHSWNDGKSNVLRRELPRDSYEIDLTDGVSNCQFIMRNVTQTNGREFNLANSTYFALLAKGPMRNQGLGYHSIRASTQQPVNFTAFDVLESEGVSDAIKIHGTFMVTAWVGFVSLGILLARHFKSSWDNKTMCGVKIWFALHRSFMIAALIFVVIAFIVIFVHKDGWNYQSKNPHAVLGCIATALGLFQPIMAIFRPAADHPKRYIFNWLHFIVGNAAQIIAVITIFFAVSLQSSGLKESFYWIMAVFVIVYLLIHLFFQVHTWSAEKKKNNEVKMIDLAGRGSNSAGAPEKNLVNEALRVIFLGVYTIFLVVILITLYALIGVA
ncbi:putative ferric-chelate reductase 1 homolog [Nephila pilipes]|uniref:Putative ferric-chelate reductase 1 homolog n=1 Tax=Nephila pilipes TaxID=299642 RepID=A0A8X6IPC6_NEPPI|nr:putative ferric-chelate reductase 1 homolog [Nephila pilipes]